jgi:hypothetical protein
MQVSGVREDCSSRLRSRCPGSGFCSIELLQLSLTNATRGHGYRPPAEPVDPVDDEVVVPLKLPVAAPTASIAAVPPAVGPPRLSPWPAPSNPRPSLGVVVGNLMVGTVPVAVCALAVSPKAIVSINVEMKVFNILFIVASPEGNRFYTEGLDRIPQYRGEIRIS